jgi:hypothetical protein
MKNQEIKNIRGETKRQYEQSFINLPTKSPSSTKNMQTQNGTLGMETVPSQLDRLPQTHAGIENRH